MRRALGILLLTAALAALFVSATAAGGDDDAYEVRAIFDNAGFLVPGEDVRVAGANVGSVAEIDVTDTEEAAHADGSPEPGKAVVVLRIEDPAFQDFREDASCLVRPQSLIGERFVECNPTRPRAAGSEAPPELEVIPEDEPGAGQRLLPVEQNGKTIDIDLLNNVLREPYADRFRLILNDLGAGLAARGEELAEIVERSNPALRETNEVLAILARQNRALASLATDSDRILTALVRERDSVVGFINESETTAAATAERSADLEESFARFPEFLRELRSTMVELRGFSDAATPVFGDLREAAPSLTAASRALEPFASASEISFETLGDAAEESGAPLRDADPVIRQIRALARSGESGMRDFAQLLSTLRKTGGFDAVFEAIFGLGGSVNAFDDYGHFLRLLIPTNSCFDYTAILQPGCGANFTGPASAIPTTAAQQERALAKLEREMRRSDKREGRDQIEAQPGGEDAVGGLLPDEDGVVGSGPRVPEPDVEPQRTRATRDLLDFLIGEPEREDTP
jgi:ABC-type transporter Mla subunit MlaD